jgi:hypothetical protein
MEPDSERRDDGRYSTDQLIHIEFGSDEFLVAEGVNISSGGILCKAPYPIRTSEKIRVQLTLSGTDFQPFSTETEGTVVHIENDADGGYLIGIRFDMVPVNSSAAIERFLTNVKADYQG